MKNNTNKIETMDETSIEITDIFLSQKLNHFRVKATTPEERIQKLIKLKSILQTNEDKILDTITTDIHRPALESKLIEIDNLYNEIDFTIERLAAWMKPKEVPANIVKAPGKVMITHEPKGICLIIAPWNLSLLLLISPLISAIAAGNCCILKPSELAPTTSSVIADLISEIFEPGEITVCEGGHETLEALLALPFDHIFFTGSTKVGKIVMAAASKNLSTYTLELGGKSPVIVDTEADLLLSAEKIVSGKFINAGQSCVAPDYVFVHESQKNLFVTHLIAKIKELYINEKGQLTTAGYAKIINNRHLFRLDKLLQNALNNGARINFGGKVDVLNRIVEPTILTDVPLKCTIMLEEIFGPILPVITYRHIDEALQYIAALQYVAEHNKPLALYAFSENQQTIGYIIGHSSSGGVCINDTVLQAIDPNLPFRGVNAYGMGSYKGYYGFLTFSQERSVVRPADTKAKGPLYPPY